MLNKIFILPVFTIHCPLLYSLDCMKSFEIMHYVSTDTLHAMRLDEKHTKATSTRDTFNLYIDDLANGNS